LISVEDVSGAIEGWLSGGFVDKTAAGVVEVELVETKVTTEKPIKMLVGTGEIPRRNFVAKFDDGTEFLISVTRVDRKVHSNGKASS